MKTRLLLLASFMGLQLAAHAQKYQMDVEVRGGQITSYVVNDLQDVVCKDTTTTITLANKETVVYNNKEVASLSWTVVTKFLREELGFVGVVITDSFNMAPVRNRFDSGEAAAAADVDCTVVFDDLLMGYSENA